MKNLFRYPKHVGLGNLELEGIEIFLNHEVREWVEEIINVQLKDRIKIIAHHRIRPWSQVFKVETDGQKVYFLKIPASEFSQEALITETIESLNFEFTTGIIARNNENGAFLMAAFDGETLRTKLRNLTDESFLVTSSAKMGKFQKDVKEYISQFEQMEIPKWTPKSIINDCKILISKPRFTSLTSLNQVEIIAFKSLFPQIEEMLTDLDKFDNGCSIDHGDFQDNNIFIYNGRSIFMDWADASVTIPSFTIATYCHSFLLAHPKITNKPKLIENILSNYFYNLLGYKDGELNETHLTLIHYLYPIMCILKVSRLLNLNCEKSDTYTTTILDYWIRIVISFTRFYQNKSLRN